VSDGDPLTPQGLFIAQHPSLAQLFAVGALTIETFYIVALFSRRLRPWIGLSGALLVGIRTLMGPTFEPYLVCALFSVPWHRVEDRVTRLILHCPPTSAAILSTAGHGQNTAL